MAAYQKSNPGKVNAITVKYQVAKLKAIPSWLTDRHWGQIEEFYIKSTKLTKETGIEYQVDHIIPLQGENVSGLHVPWNLQILTKHENTSKGNRTSYDIKDETLTEKREENEDKK